MLIKSKIDLTNLEISGKKIGAILQKLASLCKPEITTAELDVAAERMIRAAGGLPAFKGYRIVSTPTAFPATVCVSINEELVHGIPNFKRVIKNGDLVSLDIGMQWPKGLQTSDFRLQTLRHKRPKSEDRSPKTGVFTDTAVTLHIGQPPEKTAKLMAVTKEALEVGIRAAQPGSSVASIGKAIETFVKSQGQYGIVRDLVGHGVGHAVHEEPHIPNYYDPALESAILKPGMVIAIEPMVTLGGWQVKTLRDGWTIKTKDNSLCAHFEHTLIITKKGNLVVTRRPAEIV